MGALGVGGCACGALAGGVMVLGMVYGRSNPGDEANEQRETLFWYEPGVGKLGQGFFAELYSHVGQWGTHVDPPLIL
ncbi:MAG: putative redox-active protein (C_GCAxxG_C_C) [Syntrophorhabdus sp. PtaU1.Bin153]|nr:MAG: putative redox-active protein (C_GCAxxG_C_C) [Syntrophorhabdus sp. PtaU1.Bin153]